MRIQMVHTAEQGFVCGEEFRNKECERGNYPFYDDDCIADKRWLEELVKGFTDEGIGELGDG